MGPSRGIVSNQDIADRVAASGVEIYPTSDGDLHLHCEFRDEDRTAQIRAHRGIVVLADRVTDKIIGLVITEYESWAFAELPDLRQVWNQYLEAKTAGDHAAQHDAAVRLFLGTACTAIPALTSGVLAAYEKWRFREPAFLERLTRIIETILKGPLQLQPQPARFRGAARAPVDSTIQAIGPGDRRHQVKGEPIWLYPSGFVSADIRLPAELAFPRGRYSLRLAPKGPEDPESVEIAADAFEGDSLHIRGQVPGWNSLPKELRDKVAGRVGPTEVLNISSVSILEVVPLEDGDPAPDE